jgi:hypothetical protein
VPPGFFPTNILQNATLEVLYNEPLNPNTVNLNTVLLRSSGTGQLVAGTVTLDASGTLIRFAPNVPLAANTFYGFQTTSDIRGLNGLSQGSFQTLVFFTTGNTSDTTPPVVTLVSPPDGSSRVPVNADIRVRFNKAINPLTVNAGTIQVSGGGQTAVASSISFSNNNQEVVLTPQEAFPDNTLMTVAIAGVQDLAGNMVVSRTTQFMTGAGPTTVQALVITETPVNGDTSVPVNTLITAHANVPIDPGTVNSNSFQLIDRATNQVVAGSYSVSADGQTLSLVPNAALAVNRNYVVFAGVGMRDLAGNSATCGDNFFCSAFGSIAFTTSATADTVPPTVVGVSPPDQVNGVPINTQVLVQFSEPVNPLTLGQVTVSSAGGPVTAVPTLSNGQTTLLLTPAIPLAASTQYSVSVAGVQDLSGNVMTAAVTTSFVTGPGADLVRPQVSTVSPADGATGVATNAVVEAQFSKRMDALTITNAAFQVSPSGGNPIAGTITVAADGRSATFTPSAPLSPSTTYRVRLSVGITDLTGQNFGFLGLFDFNFSFTTGLTPVTTGPQVVAANPQNGDTGVAVNAHVVVALSEPVEPLSVGSSAIALAAGGASVPGSIALSSDRTKLTFTPASLAANTAYTVTVAGFTDQAGNLVTPFTDTFTTGASTAPDQSLLQVLSVNPPNNATGIPVTSNVVITLSKSVDPTTVSNASINIGASGGNFSLAQIAGSYSVSGAVVTFTPLTPLPGNRSIQVRVSGSLLDESGNIANFFSSSFTTAAVTDVTAPQVLSVAPTDGSSNIGLNATVVLTFSKSLNPSTVNNNTFGLLANSGVPLGVNVSISADNRTVMLNANPLPASSVVTVVTTGGVQDLSGNALPSFRSQFTTSSNFDVTHASVSNQRPANGASGVGLNSSIVLFVNEPLNTGMIAGAVHVSQNGLLVQGAVNVRDSGQSIEFVPASPWQGNALVEIALDSSGLDTDGSPVNSYQGSFRTATDPSTVAPSPVSSNPSGFFTTNVLENTTLEILYNEPLNPSTVNTGTVLLRNAGTGQSLAGTVTLDPSGTLIQFLPGAPLAANTTYQVVTTQGITGVNGLTQTSVQTVTRFTTGNNTDATPPVVTLVSPPDGSSGVPANADIRVRFNKVINPLTVNAGTIQVSGGGQTAVASSINFSNNNQEVVLTPQEAFPDNTLMTVAIAGVQDLAGNRVLSKTTQFRTGAGPATVQAVVIMETPVNGDTSVPVNTLITAHANVAIDPGTVNSNSFQLIDRATNQVVAGSYSVSADGQTLSFVPNAALAVNRNYVVFAGAGMTDLAGNGATCGDNFLCFAFGNIAFTTSATTDTVPPTVVGVSPPDQVNGVPINTQVLVQFSEPINPLTLGQVTLSSANGPVTVVSILLNGQTTLLLTPAIPLAANTQYSLSVPGVQDLSGNVMTAPVTTGFTTGTGADLVRPQVSAVSPANGATGVATHAVVEAQFSKRMDALTITNATFEVSPSGGNPISGTITVAADGQSATFTPTAPLSPSTTYQVRLTEAITDLTGQDFGLFAFFDFFSSFTTGAQ